MLVYEVVFEASVAFHHSNWRLPFWLERPLSWILVTPRMHGIHHSTVRREADSNYSNLFNLWDRVHRTIRLNVRQDEITVGVPGYRDAHDLTVFRLLALPFRRQRECWKTPDARPLAALQRAAAWDAARSPGRRERGPVTTVTRTGRAAGGRGVPYARRRLRMRRFANSSVFF